ncbi:MAG: Bax inhibitor-1 family protein [Candidatus Azosocius agrarius]|nr:MAG: Bax inhibitor-1 family protein [Gammaproteobacteria bacterium]
MNKYIKGYKIGYNDLLLTNKVIRNTYILLSITLLFSAFMSWISVVVHSTPVGFMVFFIYIPLYYLVNVTKNSYYGIFFLFVLTGFMGYTLGPLLNIILYRFANGQEIVMLSFGLTSCLFVLLSFYALLTKKDFNYLSCFLFVSVILVLILSFIGMFFFISWVNLLVSFIVVMLSCGYILYDTSLLINGGERNYVVATINLYLNFFNLFVSLLRILGFFVGRRD